MKYDKNTPPPIKQYDKVEVNHYFLTTKTSKTISILTVKYKPEWDEDLEAWVITGRIYEIKGLFKGECPLIACFLKDNGKWELCDGEESKLLTVTPIKNVKNKGKKK